MTDYAQEIKECIAKGDADYMSSAGHYAEAAEKMRAWQKADPSMTQRKMADAIGMSAPWVNRVLKGGDPWAADNAKARLKAKAKAEEEAKALADKAAADQAAWEEERNKAEEESKARVAAAVAKAKAESKARAEARAEEEATGAEAPEAVQSTKQADETDGAQAESEVEEQAEAGTDDEEDDTETTTTAAPTPKQHKALKQLSKAWTALMEVKGCLDRYNYGAHLLQPMLNETEMVLEVANDIQRELQAQAAAANEDDGDEEEETSGTPIPEEYREGNAKSLHNPVTVSPAESAALT